MAWSLWYNVLVRKGKGNLPEMLGGNKMKNVKNGYRIGIETRKGLKLSKSQYTLGDALEIMYKASFPCMLCDHIGTPVKL